MGLAWLGVLWAAHMACNGGPPAPADLYIGPPGTTETHVAVTVQPGAVGAGTVWRLASNASVDGRSGTAYLPDPPQDGPLDLPVQYVIVAKDAQGMLNVTVDALAQDGRVVGRGLGSVELIPNQGASLSLTLGSPCQAPADCSDGLRCNGEEVCSDGVCGPGINPCPPSTGCVDRRCEEAVAGCIPERHPDRCGSGEYCDLVEDCQPGVPCMVDEDCSGLGDLCYPLVCSAGHCVNGVPVNPDDSNPCTVDVCLPDQGPRNFNLAEGNVCSAAADPQRKVCKQPADGGVLNCLPSSCGDSFRDLSNGEECDLGQANDDEVCTRNCRFPRCGDGIVSASLLEDCDDQNANTGDDCVGCRFSRCGDGYIHSEGTAPFEQCDNGALNGLSACSPTCRLTTFEVLQIMGAGAPCPATTTDGGFELPPVDAGWDYINYGPVLSAPEGDARCRNLTDVSDVALRTVTLNGTTSVTDELVVMDATGMVVVNIRTLEAQTLFPPENMTPIRACTTAAGPWLLAGGDGLPGSAEGVEGIIAYNNAIIYRTAQTHRIFKARLDIPNPSQPSIQFFSYVGGSNYSIGACCPADRRQVWRDSACDSCPTVPFRGVPYSYFDFAGRIFLIMPDADRRQLHAVDEIENCELTIVTFAACAERDADGGLPTDDAGPGTAWRHSATVPAACREGSSTAVLLSSTDTHEITRGGANLPGDIPLLCLPDFRVVAGTKGQSGISTIGSKADESAIDAPTGVGQDSNCNFYFAETGSQKVRLVTRDGLLRDVADIPGLRTLTVHPTLGVVATTATAVYLLVPRSGP